MMNDNHRPLANDIQWLGRLLGDIIRRHEGQPVFDCIESVRAATKAGRDGGAGQLEAIQDELRGLAPDEARAVTRGFGHFLTLANVAEQHHRLRRRRDYQRSGRPEQPGSLDVTLSRLIAEGHKTDSILEALESQRVTFVLTAHPTEITRSTTVQKLRHIAELLRHNDRPDLTASERAELGREMEATITALWLTDEVRHTTPTPLDEVRSGLFWFEQTLWDAVADFARNLDAATQRHLGRRITSYDLPIRFGSWMGGDRDGNPKVTAAVTRRAVCLSRVFACTLFRREIDALAEELSLDAASDALGVDTAHTREPYRVVLNPLILRLKEARHHWLGGYRNSDGRVQASASMPITCPALRDELLRVRRSLLDVGAEALADGRILDILRRLEVFGLVLARVDIRQDAAVYARIADHLTGGTWTSANEVERLALLQRIPTDALSPEEVLGATGPNDSEATETILLLLSLDEIGPDAIGQSIISMASRASDVLLVEALHAWAGVRTPPPVVPLFETVEDLQGAPEALDTLFTSRVNGPSTQEVMIGYSDSAKTGGRLASAWALYEAQERMVAVARRHGTRLTFFHGRGGTVGRGGGPMSLAIQSQPPLTIEGRLRVTEQGEMIQAKFGLRGIAERTLEVATTSVLETSFTDAVEIPAAWRDAMHTMSRESMRSYRGLVQEDDRFLKYFRQCTPERELSHLRIGSRPKRRPSGGTGVSSLRAIPWVFAWMQTRWLLPSWLGVDRGLAAVDIDLRREMVHGWPFFRSFLDLQEMVLAKAEMRIAETYEKALVDPDLHDLGSMLRGRFAATRFLVLESLGREFLLEDQAVLARSIAVRNPYVDPINLAQIDALRKVRQDEGDTVALELLLRTMNGIAAGLRNTG